METAETLTARPYDYAEEEPAAYGGPAVVLPSLVSRIDGAPLHPTRRAVRFAEALAFDDSWAAISDARRRRLL